MIPQLSLGNFYGIDSLIDFFIILISLLIYRQSKIICKIIKERKFYYFSLAFLGIAIAYFFKIIINLTFIYYVSLSNMHIINCISCILESLEIMQIVNLMSFILFKLFIMSGFLILFLITSKNINKKYIVLFTYFSIIITFASLYNEFIFNFTIVVILSSLLIYFYNNFKKIKTKQSKFIFISFIPILLSNILEIFYNNGTTIHLVEEILLFIGFLILFLTHLNIRIKNDKKNKIRSN